MSINLYIKQLSSNQNCSTVAFNTISSSIIISVDKIVDGNIYPMIGHEDPQR